MLFTQGNSVGWPVLVGTVYNILSIVDVIKKDEERAVDFFRSP